MTSNLPAIPDGMSDGLEDLEGGVALPRLTLKHADRVFKAGDTNEEYPKLVGVILGMVRQRVMWNPEVGEDKARPQCKSSDGLTGYPNVRDKGSDDEFPWDEFPLNEAQAPKDEHGRPVLSCKGCPFSEWGKDKKGKAVPPPCKERFSFPIVYNRDMDPTGPFDAAGVFSVQGSGIKPARTYLSAFKVGRQPVFSAVTEVGLLAASRGSVQYSIPEFKRVGNSDVSDWADYAAQYEEVRAYLRAAPRPEDDGSSKSEGYVAPEQAVPAAPEQAAPTVPAKNDDIQDAVIVSETSNVPTPASAPDEDELPF